MIPLDIPWFELKTINGQLKIPEPVQQLDDQPVFLKGYMYPTRDNFGLLPAQVAALSSIAIPIVAIVSGMLILNEPLSALQTVAIASTVVSLWLALVPGRAR